MKTASRLPVLMLLLAGCSGGPGERSASPVKLEPAIEFRFEDTGAPLENRVYADPGGAPDRVALLAEVVLDESHMLSAVAEPNDVTGAYGVWVELTPGGRDRLARATEAHAGQRLGIVVDGKLLALPVVRNRISATRVPLALDLSAEAAAALARRVNDLVAKS